MRWLSVALVCSDGSEWQVHGAEEIRDIFRASANKESCPVGDLARNIRARFAPLGGVDLDIHPRDAMREPPQFGENCGGDRSQHERRL